MVVQENYHASLFDTIHRICDRQQKLTGEKRLRSIQAIDYDWALSHLKHIRIVADCLSFCRYSVLDPSGLCLHEHTHTHIRTHTFSGNAVQVMKSEITRQAKGKHCALRCANLLTYRIESKCEEGKQNIVHVLALTYILYILYCHTEQNKSASQLFHIETQ